VGSRRGRGRAGQAPTPAGGGAGRRTATATPRRAGSSRSRRNVVASGIVPKTAFGAWQPFTLSDVVAVFASAPFRWWISGGHALDLHLGRALRLHEDNDVGVGRADLGSGNAFLSHWEQQVARPGHRLPRRG